ncbi:MAG: Xaa-Pro peptidase family protein [Acidimicrobiales bacterium]
MTEPLSADSIKSRKSRIDGVLRRMDEQGFDVLLLSLGADLPWLTGYLAMPLERLTVHVLRRDGESVLIVPELEAPRVAPAPDLFELRPWKEGDDPFEIAARIAGGAALKTVGISDRAWASSLLTFQTKLPDVNWRPASEVTSALRAVKDDFEVESLRAASAAADRVAIELQGGEIAMVGRTEAEVSDDISARLVAEGHDHVNFAIVGSGPNAASPHHHASERRISRGEAVVCDFGGSLSVGGDVGYCSDITRTVCMGEASDPEVAKCYEVLKRAQKAGVDAVRPGVTAESVDAAARKVIDDAGLGDRFIHRTGHGIGIEEHEDPYIISGNRVILEKGHAFSVEPGIYIPGRFGMRLEDIVVVTDDGCESLNKVDHSMVLLDA